MAKDVKPVVFGRKAGDSRWLGGLKARYGLVTSRAEVPDELLKDISARILEIVLDAMSIFMHSPAVPSTRPDISIAIAYGVNVRGLAQAVPLKLDTDFLIVFDVKNVKKIRDAAARLCAFLDRGSIGPLLRARQKGVSLEQTVDEITFSSVLLLFFHELAHIRRRHFEVLAAPSFMDGGAAMAPASGPPNVPRRAIEIDADLWAAIYLGVLRRKLGKTRKLWKSRTFKEEFEFTILAAWIMFDMLSEYAGLNPIPDYHSAAVRVESLIRGFAGAYDLNQDQMNRGRGVFVDALRKKLIAVQVQRPDPWLVKLHQWLAVEPRKGDKALLADYRRSRAAIGDDHRDFEETEAYRFKLETSGKLKDRFAK